ncbi:MAG: NUDIX domain-containing protein [Nitrososphaerota archaeon]|nr:NUDIX domain-containing protein [Nitrososphaerota archaeon]
MAREEKVDLVDESDRVIGVTTVGECLSGGLLHRAVAVVVSRPDGKVLLQLRSKKDLWHPGRWTLSCTGHVRKGESYEEAASRELEEEIGIRAALSPVKKYLMPPIRDEGMTEREWVALFSAVSDAEAMADPVELDGVKGFTPQELRVMLDGGRLTPDAVFLLTEFLRAGAQVPEP